MVSIKVKNIKKIQSLLNKYGDDAIVHLEEAIIDEATRVAQIAKVKAPVNNGTLQNSIAWEKETSLSYNVGTNLPYAPYVEFGTGSKVQVPTEFKDMAMKFKGSGGGGVPMKGQSFQDGLDAITDWCKRKGIPIVQARWIFLKILGAGINPQPFMYPAYLEGKKTFKTSINKAIKKLNKKYNG